MNIRATFSRAMGPHAVRKAHTSKAARVVCQNNAHVYPDLYHIHTTQHLLSNRIMSSSRKLGEWKSRRVGAEFKLPMRNYSQNLSLHVYAERISLRDIWRL